jgi:hypothetical protein
MIGVVAQVSRSEVLIALEGRHKGSMLWCFPTDLQLATARATLDDLARRLLDVTENAACALEETRDNAGRVRIMEKHYDALATIHAEARRLGYSREAMTVACLRLADSSREEQ